MEKFDPNAYLSELDEKENFESASQEEFDPNAYLSESDDRFELSDEDINLDKDPSQLEALARGVGQEATFGLSDEIIGGLSAAKETVLGDDRLENILETYRRERDIQREAEKRAEEAHPGTYLTGQIVGGVAPAFVTGGASAVGSIAAKGLSKAALKKAAVSGAKYGAGQAFGESKTDLTKGDIDEYGQMLKDVTIGGGIGAGAGIGTPVAMKGVSKFSEKVLVPTAKHTVGFLSGMTNKDVENTMRLAEKIRNAGTIDEFGEHIAKKADQIYDDIMISNKLARGVLSEQKIIPKSEFIDTINNKIEKFEHTSYDSVIPHYKKVIKLINKKAVDGQISDLDIKEIMQDIGKKAYKGLKKDTEDVVKLGLRELRYDLSSYLKNKNNIYKEFISPLEKKYDALDDLKKMFKLDTDSSNRFIIKSEDTLERKLSKLGTERGGKDVEKLLKTVSQLVNDEGFIDDALAVRLAQDLSKRSKMNWTAKDIARIALGFSTGSPIPAAIAIGSGPVSKALLKQSDRISKIAKIPISATDKVLGVKGQKYIDATKFATEQIVGRSIGEKTIEKNKKETIKTMNKNILKASPEDITNIAQELREKGIDQYANVLDNISQLSENSRKARLTILLQQKAFKEAIGYNKMLEDGE